MYRETYLSFADIRVCCELHSCIHSNRSTLYHPLLWNVERYFKTKALWSPLGETTTEGSTLALSLQDCNCIKRAQKHDNSVLYQCSWMLKYINLMNGSQYLLCYRMCYCVLLCFAPKMIRATNEIMSYLKKGWGFCFVVLYVLKVQSTTHVFYKMTKYCQWVASSEKLCLLYIISLQQTMNCKSRETMFWSLTEHFLCLSVLRHKYCTEQ